MDYETIYERIKEDLRRTAERAMTDNGHNFEQTMSDMQTALEVVLDEMAETIYK